MENYNNNVGDMWLQNYLPEKPKPVEKPQPTTVNKTEERRKKYKQQKQKMLGEMQNGNQQQSNQQ